jgi:transcriptional regulator with XRE-family HTH domain
MAFDDATQKQQTELHLGHNIQRIREIIGMKQSTLADNAEMSQQNVSRLESSPIIADDTLELLAKGLGVTPEFVKSFTEEKAVYNIQNNFTVQDHGSFNNQPNIYSSEFAVQLIEKLLESEKEKVALLKELLQEARTKKD